MVRPTPLLFVLTALGAAAAGAFLGPTALHHDAAPAASGAPAGATAAAAAADAWAAPDTTPPALAISAPADGASLGAARVLVAGRTEPGALVSVGGVAADVQPDGSWIATLSLSEGENVAQVRAWDRHGNVTTARLTVHHRPEPAAARQRLAATSYTAFTAYQAYGSCSDDPPFDAFSGTATPGSEVAVLSAYGSATTVADTDGHWSARVEFARAPVRQPFAVTAGDGTRSATFAFVRER